MVRCPDNQKIFLKMCISFEDYYLILLNIIVITSLILGVIIRLLIDYNKRKNLKINITNSFCLLGEGPLSCFYSIFTTQTKSHNNKKKAHKNINQSDKNNNNNNNELKCNNCSRTLELTYHNTLPKLINNNIN